MLRILKHAKPYLPVVLLSVCLLFLQAYCDLSLPNFMSRIVNIGISQGGVEIAVPEAIRESEFDRLRGMLLQNPESREKLYHIGLTSSYDLRTPDDYDGYGAKYPALADGNVYTLRKSRTFWDRAPLEGIAEIFAFQFRDLPGDVRAQAAARYVISEYEALGMDVRGYRMSFILKSGAQMLAFALLSMAVVVLVSFLSARFGSALGRDLRKLVFSKVINFSNAELDNFSAASLITRTTNDVQQVQMSVTMIMRMGIYAPVMGIGGIVMVLGIDSGMTWIIAIAVAVVLAFIVVIFSLAMPRFKIMQTLVDNLNLVTREALTGMMVIRAFGTQRHEEKKFDKANADLTDTGLFVGRVMSSTMPIMSVIMSFTSVAVLWFGAGGVDAGVIQVGNMMAFIQYATQILMSFMMISMFMIILPRASVSAGRIADVLETEPAVKDSEKPQKFGTARGLVQFKNVSFKYPGADEYVLRDISFSAAPGETVAFIGSTGSGKSTLVNLIPRFYDATDGEILVDGIDIKRVSQHDLREKIGYVPQRGVLFTGTVASNIKFGGGAISDGDMYKAAETAQAAGFIAERPDKYGDGIAQGGANVSGGQKQRLSIARALAKKPEIYIFDDSFSALDYKTDAALRAALAGETENSAVLIVAQRINTIRNADRIVVLNEGRVAGIGTHTELLRGCEVYRQIAESQLPCEQLEAGGAL